LVTEAMGQVDELEPHAVVVVLLEQYATDFLRHAIPPRAGYSMIPKSGCRFSEEIMLHSKCSLGSTTEAVGL
jgi:hypothetical protein